jgi:DNA end-binding protein Ku
VLAKGDYLVLELLRFAHEMKDVKEVNYLSEVNKRVRFTERELKMAEDLIKGMTAKWKPEKYKDTYYDDMMKRIKAKVKQGRGKKVEDVEEVEEIEESSNVVDLLPLLRKSLQERDGGRKKAATRRKAPAQRRA